MQIRGRNTKFIIQVSFRYLFQLHMPTEIRQGVLSILCTNSGLLRGVFTFSSMSAGLCSFQDKWPRKWQHSVWFNMAAHQISVSRSQGAKGGSSSGSIWALGRLHWQMALRFPRVIQLLLTHFQLKCLQFT